MAASFLASTAILIALALLNIVLITAGHPTAAVMQLFSLMGKRIESLHQIKLLLLSLDFFFIFFSFTMAIRYYNHLGFMINAPQMRIPRHLPRWSKQSSTARHYPLGMQGYYLSVPLALWLFGPGWLLAGTLIIIAPLCRVDRTGYFFTSHPEQLFPLQMFPEVSEYCLLTVLQYPDDVILAFPHRMA